MWRKGQHKAGTMGLFLKTTTAFRVQNWLLNCNFRSPVWFPKIGPFQWVQCSTILEANLSLLNETASKGQIRWHCGLLWFLMGSCFLNYGRNSSTDCRISPKNITAYFAFHAETDQTGRELEARLKPPSFRLRVPERVNNKDYRAPGGYTEMFWWECAAGTLKILSLYHTTFSSILPPYPILAISFRSLPSNITT